MKKKMKYTKPIWAVQQITRGSGLIENICKHGVGHPNEDSLKDMEKMGLKGFGVHGCDGCCFKKKKFKVTLDLEYEVFAEDEDSVMNQLENDIARENQTIENEFWDNLEIKEMKK
jgi:hypothetical protein